MLSLLKETWDKIQDDLRSKAGHAAYRSWLADLRPLALERSTCFLEAANRMACDRIRLLYTPLIEECLSAGFGTHIAVRVTPAVSSRMPEALDVSPSRPIVDDSNRTAFLVLKSLLEQRRDLPSNLFFFHGSSGVGKSFLLRWWRDMSPSRVAIHEGLALRKAFQLKVRDAKLEELAVELGDCGRAVVVDGVHRFANHHRAQQELAKILRARIDSDALTILTSRWHPREIWHLDRGLESFFLSGFVAELKPPGHDARLRYLRALEGKASRNGRATKVEDLARELRGSYADLHRGFVMSRQEHERSRPDEYLQLIDPAREFKRLRDRVVAHFEIPIDELMGKGQARRVTLARQILAWLSVQSGLSQAEVGRHMNGRSRASISYCIKRIEKRMAESAGIRRLIEGLL